MLEYSPVFKQSIESVPKILRRRLGLPEIGRSQLDSVFFTSREAILKAIQKSGDPANVVPFLGVKISSIFVDPESYNSHALKREGLVVGITDEGNSAYVFYGRPVKVEMECFMFSDDFNQVLSVVQQILFLESELNFMLNIEEDAGFKITLAINKEGLSIPEADFQSQISSFEFSFPAYIKTYAGIIQKLPLVKKVKLQGGPVIEYIENDEVVRRVDRALGIAVGSDPNSPNDIISFKLGLNQDLINTNQPLDE